MKARGEPPIELNLCPSFEGGIGIRHVPPSRATPEESEKLGGVDLLLAPPRGLPLAGLLSDCQASREDDEDFCRIQRGRETPKLEGSVRLDLGKVDEGVFADVDVRDSELSRGKTLCILAKVSLAIPNRPILFPRRKNPAPTAQVPPFRILTEQNWCETIPELCNGFTKVNDLSWRVGVDEVSSVQSDVDSALSLTRLTNRTLAPDGFDESEESKDVLDSSVTLEDGGNELALLVAILSAD